MYPKIVESLKKVLDEHKVEEIQVLDLKSTNPFTDYYLIGTVNNERQLLAVGDYIEEEVDKEGLEVLHKEGTGDSGWVIYDCGEVIVHLFISAVRQEINLEKLIEEVVSRKSKK